jgi:hypothetical protein
MGKGWTFTIQKKGKKKRKKNTDLLRSAAR